MFSKFCSVTEYILEYIVQVEFLSALIIYLEYIESRGGSSSETQSLL